MDWFTTVVNCVRSVWKDIPLGYELKDDNVIEVWPALIERSGGARDGELFIPFFTFNISEFFMIFQPHVGHINVSWIYDRLIFKFFINSIDVTLHLRANAPASSPIVATLYEGKKNLKYCDEEEVEENCGWLKPGEFVAEIVEEEK
jgi:hypothetical protein